MRYNNIQGQDQDIMRTKFVNNTLEYLRLNSNKITDVSAINQYLQNFTGLRHVELDANPMNFQNTKKIVQDTNLSYKKKYTLDLYEMSELSVNDIEELVISWKLKLYDMYVKDQGSFDGKEFTFRIKNGSINHRIWTENGEVKEYINYKLHSTLSLADFVQTMRPDARRRSKTSAFTMKYYIKRTLQYTSITPKNFQTLTM